MVINVLSSHSQRKYLSKVKTTEVTESQKNIYGNKSPTENKYICIVMFVKLVF